MWCLKLVFLFSITKFCEGMVETTNIVSIWAEHNTVLPVFFVLFISCWTKLKTMVIFFGRLSNLKSLKVFCKMINLSLFSQLVCCARTTSSFGFFERIHWRKNQASKIFSCGHNQNHSEDSAAISLRSQEIIYQKLFIFKYLKTVRATTSYQKYSS